MLNTTKNAVFELFMIDSITFAEIGADGIILILYLKGEKEH
jgi:hypothetical protein